ncbi:DNA-packaging protein [Erythrobacter sp. 3-20A1M]|uniref:DNA-packaging protein n=1 Tax=Erythrobacter sp. 3-20A1M TaxID=2653850 RepID=UPI00203B4DB8|nr:terminase family protein [Erythrobacter sp. 3-20A1M]
MAQDERLAFDKHWELQAHDGQIAPPGEWSTWLLMAGRGFGKTRAGAEWARAVAQADGTARIALVGASLAEARAIMVEGPSGLLAVAGAKQRPRFEPSKNLLRWPGGAEARLYSAAEPESLRGPQHSHAWCDELAKWPASTSRAEACWDNLQLGLRLGRDPRSVVTTTPRAVPLVRRLIADEGTVVTGGTTLANARNLSPGFIAVIERQYAGTSFGRQELNGELLAEVDGALWSRALLERCREAASPPACGTGSGGGPAPDGAWSRVVIGVDPPASAQGDACGIVVAALLADGTALVLADASVERPSPERWARAVAEAAAAWHADRVVAEANQGGAMVASVLRAAEITLPVKLVHASRGKTARAEPVAALYEAGRVRHAALFAKLEDELCGLMAGGGYEGPGRSPDRADALVWALTELMLGRVGRPQVVGF